MAVSDRIALSMVRGMRHSAFTMYDYLGAEAVRWPVAGHPGFWTVSQRTIKTLPAFECAINVLAYTMAGLPKTVAMPAQGFGDFEGLGQRPYKAIDHPVNELLANPCGDWLDAHLFWKQYYTDRFGSGNAHALIVRTMERPYRLIPARCVNTDWKGSLKAGTLRPVKSLSLAIGSETERDKAGRMYDAADILSLHGPHYDPTRQMSPSPIGTYAKPIIGATQAAYAYLERGLTTGVNQGTAIEADREMLMAQQLDDEDLEDMEEEIIEKYAGAHNAGKPIVLPPGFSLSGSAVSAVDLQLIEWLKFSIEDASRIYNIPPRLLHYFQQGTRISQTLEAQSADFARNTVKGLAEEDGSSLTKNLLTEREQEAELMVHVDWPSISLGTLTERLAAAGRAYSTDGIAKKNEARAVGGLAPVSDEEGGNDFHEPKGAPAGNQPNGGSGDNTDGDDND